MPFRKSKPLLFIRFLRKYPGRNCERLNMTHQLLNRIITNPSRECQLLALQELKSTLIQIENILLESLQFKVNKTTIYHLTDTLYNLMFKIDSNCMGRSPGSSVIKVKDIHLHNLRLQAGETCHPIQMWEPFKFSAGKICQIFSEWSLEYYPIFSDNRFLSFSQKNLSFAIVILNFLLDFWG